MLPGVAESGAPRQAALGWSAGLSTATGLLAWALPKCPLCLAGYSAAFATLGIGSDTLRWTRSLFWAASAVALLVCLRIVTNRSARSISCCSREDLEASSVEGT